MVMKLKETLAGIYDQLIKLNTDVKLMEVITEDDVRLEVEAIAIDEPVFVVTDGEEAERVAAPDGEYVIKDSGVKITVAEGVIKEVEESEAVKETEEEDEELAEEKQYASKEEVQALSEAVAELKSAIESMMKPKEELKEEKKEELSEEKKEDEVKLSAEPKKEIPSAPIETQEVEQDGRTFNANQNTAEERLFAKLFN